MMPLYFVGTARRDLQAFGAQAKREAGFELSKVQAGREPSDWKPMPSVGTGVREIRIHEQSEYRVLYVVEVGAAVYVLHGFKKTSQRTRKADIDLARTRLKQLHAAMRGAK